MKKQWTALACAAAMTLTLASANAEGLKIDGKIEATRTQTILAPYTGIVQDYTVRAGDKIESGEALFSLGSTAVCADFDGTVTGLFAQAGDSAAAVQERYGALCYVEHDELYMAECTTNGADSDNENRIIHIGETVYIRSTSNSDRVGVARVTSVTGSAYTLEVTEQEDLRLNEQVKVYREQRYSSSSCIGTGRVKRIDPEAVTAEGYVLSVRVTEGQKVERGETLFEMTPDRPEGAQGGSISMPEDGVLLSILCESGTQISKDTPMATWCPQDAFQLVCSVDEEDLAAITVGAKAKVTLDAFKDAPIEGTVVKIAGASSDQATGANFDVTIELAASENVRIGMNASAEL